MILWFCGGDELETVKIQDAAFIIGDFGDWAFPHGAMRIGR